MIWEETNWFPTASWGCNYILFKMDKNTVRTIISLRRDVISERSHFQIAWSFRVAGTNHSSEWFSALFDCAVIMPWGFVRSLSSVVRPSVFRIAMSQNLLVDLFQISVVACSRIYAKTFLYFLKKCNLQLFTIFCSFSLTWDLLQNKLGSARNQALLRKIPGSVIP